MKKVICILTAAALTAGLAAFGAGCGADDDENFSGDLSVEKYATVEEAAADCVMQEVAGVTTGAEFGSYERERRLGNSQIERLNLTEDEKNQLTAAEEGKITYSAALKGNELIPAEMRVIILTFGDEYAYYMPEPEEGDNLTRSYFNRMTNVDYDNFTAKMSSSLSTKTGNITITQTTDLYIKYTGTELWLKTIVPSILDPENSKNTTEIFAEDSGDALTIWMSINESDFIVTSSTDYDSIDDLMNEMTAQMNTASDIDHTFFEKTDFGFSLRDDRTESIASRMFEGLNIGDVTEYMNMEYNFYINDGAITSATANCSLSALIDEVATELSLKTLTQISDVGTTTITLPQTDTDQTV